LPSFFTPPDNVSRRCPMPVPRFPSLPSLFISQHHAFRCPLPLPCFPYTQRCAHRNKQQGKILFNMQIRTAQWSISWVSRFSVSIFSSHSPSHITSIMLVEIYKIFVKSSIIRCIPMIIFNTLSRRLEFRKS
jgi:hypothetical protein